MSNPVKVLDLLRSLSDAREEVERLKKLLSPECPGCGLRPYLGNGQAVV